MVPGLTVLTRMPSGARDRARFLDTLVKAALEAVYAGRITLWRWVECAERFTIRAHGARRSRGRAARTQRTAPRVPSWKAVSQSASASCSNRPAAGPTVFTRTL